MTAKLGIIDYGAGNLQSVRNTLAAAGFTGRLVRRPQDFEDLTHLILPGVGAFGDCARQLRAQGLEEGIRAWTEADKPFLGICIGYQILFEEGEESPGVRGLGILKGKVVRFPAGELKVPHMGWNNLSLKTPDAPLWQGLGADPFFYFVHSYYPVPAESELIAASCTYGVTFAAAIRRGNLVATQFHPEKSQQLGLRLLSNFMSLRSRS